MNDICGYSLINIVYYDVLVWVYLCIFFFNDIGE